MNTRVLLLKKVVPLYCLLLLFTFDSRLYAQVIYTDIPDATPNVTCPLDLNNDGIVDFGIHFAQPYKVVCTPLNNNAYAGNFVGGVHLPWALSSSKNICNTLSTWYDSSKPGTMALYTSTDYYWAGATDKYLALKLIVGTNTYYGWARLDILYSSGSFTLKDYAYESTPNACIQAGQTTSDINENTTRNVFSIFPNPFTTSATIQTIGSLKNATLTIYNSQGQTVKQINNISGQTITLSRNNLPGGLYFIRLTEENKMTSVKKLVIAD